MQKSSNSKVTVVIPAYNEQAVLKDLLNNLKSQLSKSTYDYSIVVVDDGSRDSTATIARTSGVTVIQHLLNSGAGSATATGLSYAYRQGSRIAVTMDADGQHLPEDVVRGIKILEENSYDLLIGSRLMNSDGMSKVKVMGNKGLSFITYILFGINVTDSQSGLRVFSLKSLEQLRWKTSGYEFCSEMLWRAKQLGLTVSEYPIKAVYTEYSRGKGQNNWNAINIIKSLLKRRVAELFG